MFVKLAIVQLVSHTITNIFSFQMGSAGSNVKGNLLDVNINPFTMGQSGMSVRTVIPPSFMTFSLLNLLFQKNQENEMVAKLPLHAGKKAQMAKHVIGVAQMRAVCGQEG